MTTYDDDFLRLELALGTHILFVARCGLEWPPPERITIAGGVIREASPNDPPSSVLARRSMSIITDEQRAGMTHVARGAAYTYEVET